MTRRRKDRWTSHLLQSDARTPWFGATIIHRARLSCSCVGWVGSSGIGPKRPARKSAKASSTSCWVFISHGPPKTTACCRAPGRVELRVDEDRGWEADGASSCFPAEPPEQPDGPAPWTVSAWGRTCATRGSASSPPPTRERRCASSEDLHRRAPQRAGWSRWPSTRCAWPSSGSSQKSDPAGAPARLESLSRLRRGGPVSPRKTCASWRAASTLGARRASAGLGAGAGGARGAGSGKPVAYASERRPDDSTAQRGRGRPPTSVDGRGPDQRRQVRAAASEATVRALFCRARPPARGSPR